MIGILFTVFVLFLLDGKTAISFYPSTKGRFGNYVELLRTSGPFAKDTAAFEMTLIQDAARAKEIRDYFQLDKEGHWNRTLEHLHEKYADGGYLHLLIPGSPNEAPLKQLRGIIKDEPRLRTIFESVYTEESDLSKRK